jgi:hypothetical protein
MSQFSDGVSNLNRLCGVLGRYMLVAVPGMLEQAEFSIDSAMWTCHAVVGKRQVQYLHGPWAVYSLPYVVSTCHCAY